MPVHTDTELVEQGNTWYWKKVEKPYNEACLLPMAKIDV